MSADKDACWGTTNSETFNEKCRMLHVRFQFLSAVFAVVVVVVVLSQRRFGQLDNFRYERASWRNEKTFASTKRVDVDDDAWPHACMPAFPCFCIPGQLARQGP